MSAVAQLSLFPQPEEATDESPALTITRCQSGDLWQLGQHRLLCGDCTKIADIQRLMEGHKAQMLFTDPPYGVDYNGGRFNKHTRERLRNDANASIVSRFLQAAISFVSGPCYMFAAVDTKGWEVFSALQQAGCQVHSLIVWHKTNAKFPAWHANYKQRHEHLLYFKPKGKTLRWSGPSNESTIWNIARDPSNPFHPTQKPITLALRALRNHKVDTVLDCFGGSGSTLLAAEQLHRACYMLEIKPYYCDVTITRWERATGHQAILLERA